MNKFQRFVVIVIGLAIAAIAAYPPWVFDIPRMEFEKIVSPERYRFAGYAPFYDPPEMRDWLKEPAAARTADEEPRSGLFNHTEKSDAYDALHARDGVRTARIDVSRLSVQMIGLIALGAALFIVGVCRKLKPEGTPKSSIERLTTASGRSVEVVS